MNLKKNILKYTGSHLEQLLDKVPDYIFKDIEEIRIRINKPLIVKTTEEYFVTPEGSFTKDLLRAFTADALCISQCMDVMSNYSLYAFEEELKNGYITVTGGHRVGICGRAVVENRQIKSIKNFNGVNIRICHEVIGCADKVMPYIINPGICHTMIISPPGCGKTTLLRDIVRQISGCEGQTVGVVDERSEIAGCCQGIPQNNVGIRTDVLDACPKEEGMLMMLRTMSPKVIAVDEIGKKQEIDAIEEIANAGVKLMCTVHGRSIEEALVRQNLQIMINKHIFQRYIILKYGKTAGEVADILDENLKSIFKGA